MGFYLALNVGNDDSSLPSNRAHSNVITISWDFFFNWVKKGLSEASFQRSPKFNYFFSLIWVHSLESSNIILDQAPLQLIHQHETHSFITLYGSTSPMHPGFTLFEDIDESYIPQWLLILQCYLIHERGDTRQNKSKQILAGFTFSSLSLANSRYAGRVDAITRFFGPLFTPFLLDKSHLSAIGLCICCASVLSLWCIISRVQTSSMVPFSLIILGWWVHQHGCPESCWSPSPEMQTLRLALSTLGVGFSSASFLCSFAHGNELMPTVIRYATSLMCYGEQNRPFPAN